jgi:prophage antirepressor-like protein
MTKENKIQLFQEKSIRTHWDEEQEKWYFSVQDIVEILSESRDVKQYIKKMRKRNPELNANWGTICTPLEMRASDGKMRKIQAADTEGILRLIQSIPSPKAEPFKQWLAKVGAERTGVRPSNGNLSRQRIFQRMDKSAAKKHRS